MSKEPRLISCRRPLSTPSHGLHQAKPTSQGLSSLRDPAISLPLSLQPQARSSLQAPTLFSVLPCSQWCLGAQGSVNLTVLVSLQAHRLLSRCWQSPWTSDCAPPTPGAGSRGFSQPVARWHGICAVKTPVSRPAQWPKPRLDASHHFNPHDVRARTIYLRGRSKCNRYTLYISNYFKATFEKANYIADFK